MRPTVSATIALAMLTACGADPNAPPTDALPAGTARTEQGLVRGVPAGGTWSYRAIPYAASPEGERRWRAPDPPATWDGERDATEFGEPCVQIAPPRKVIGREDCLTLNVWTPAERPTSPMPVLLFLHGGDNLAGSATGKTFDKLYDGQYLSARGPAVVVTANYRLGAFGWLSHPSLRDAEHGAAGNYGLLDQIAALRWISRNAAAFGGDPSRVMLFGQSAGSVDTCSLIASPLATGLVSRALMESGACYTYNDTSAATSAAAARALGCDTDADIAACMRNKSPEQVAQVPGASLVNLSYDYFYGPIIDGWVLPGQPVQMMRSGRHNHIPIVFGTNADEATTSVGGVNATISTDEAYRSAVANEVGPLLDQAIAHYPVADYPTRTDALVALISDEQYHCPARRAARAASGSQSEPVWRYVYSHTIEDAKLEPFRAGHALELQFVFGDFWEFTPTETERRLSDQMMGDWLRFAATGDPNAAGESRWPPYLVDSDPYAAIDEPMQQGAGYRSTLCDFWDSID